MQYKREQLTSEFEKEVWLLVDGSLSQGRRNFWEKQMMSFPELKSIYDDTLKILSEYNKIEQPELSESDFEEIISKSIMTKKSFFVNKKDALAKIFYEMKRKSEIGKLALASTLIAASVIILVFIGKPVQNQNLLKANY